ncbi:hypothetical protein [Methylobacterium sp. 37f]|uniref:hypothetical protein n=1 Tax=Methylobacterium sp. 37f TaxID=2817058 RepID=UPI001FFD83EB|nr:hypothetical protein [Methylobacterium sp. 37f]MCK2054198.1 hypothetical protein [Methylobacterium sp. 37f]
MAVETQGGPKDGRAKRLRRLWRRHDSNLRSSGLAQGRPLMTTRPEETDLPARGLTARELINMARAARRERPREPSTSH